MISQAVEKRLGLSSLQFNRLTQLLLLAVSVLAYNVIAMAIANSLFVTHVGAGNLPIAFILIGLCSFPAYGIFFANSRSLSAYSSISLCLANFDHHDDWLAIID